MPEIYSKGIRILLKLPRNIKSLMVFIGDICICVFTVWFSFYLRLDNFDYLSRNLLGALFISIIISIPIFVFSGFYKAIFRYSNLRILLPISKGIGLYGIFYALIITYFGIERVPRTIGIIQPFLYFFCICTFRLVIAYFFRTNIKKENKTSIQRALIYGAGNAGSKLLANLENDFEIKIIGFLDDDKTKQGRSLNGKYIFKTHNLKKLFLEKDISHILLAIPSAERFRRIEIIKKLIDCKVSIRTLPSLESINKGKISDFNLLDLDIDDLLSREIVKPFENLLLRNIANKIILVTGAGGSIGGELCRQIIKLKPNKLLILDNSEFALYNILNALEALSDTNNIKVDIYPILGSVQDKKKISQVISYWKPDTVYHAAAYKHVPLVERNLIEGIKNNVFGTLITASIAIENKVSNFVLISTDKAVRPTNAMGASKRLAEMCLQALFSNQNTSFFTKLSMVRFGNVMDSSGSVIPKFREQIKKRESLTLTHPEIKRYFMTIREAAQLVIQAGSLAEGGDVFILDMGDPIKIIDLAERMIKLSGLTLKSENNPNGDLSIKITGLRPGEKLFEEPLMGRSALKTIHPKIFKAEDPFLDWEELKKEICNLEEYIELNNGDEVLKILKNIVTGYIPSREIYNYPLRDIKY